jgi:hypothetical protein
MYVLCIEKREKNALASKFFQEVLFKELAHPSNRAPVTLRATPSR